MTAFRRILVPLDGSGLAEKALPVAMTLAQKFNGELVLLRAVDTRSLVMGLETGGAYWLAEMQTRLRAEIEEYLKAKESDLRQQGYDVSTLMGEDAPAQEIISAATDTDVDLVVMSTHGRGGVARWTYGSVADRVLRHCPCPVLLVRANMDLKED